MSEKRKKIEWKDIGISKLFIMLGAGVLLVLMSFVGFSDQNYSREGIVENKQSGETEIYITETTYEDLLEDKLRNVLVLAKDVGKVEVMITIKATGEKIALKEQTETKSTTCEADGQGGSRDITEDERTELIIYKKNSDGSQIPYIVKEMMPEIEGVVVIAEGGGNTLTVNNIIDAVMALFDVPIHKIKVLEMKLSS